MAKIQIAQLNDNVPSSDNNPLTFGADGDYFIVPVISPEMITDKVTIMESADGYFYKDGKRKPNDRMVLKAYVVGINVEGTDKVNPADYEGKIVGVVAPRSLAKSIMSTLTTPFFDTEDRKAYGVDGNVFVPSETMEDTGFTAELISLDEEGNVADKNGTIIKVSRIKTKMTEYIVTAPTGREIKKLNGITDDISNVTFDTPLSELVKQQNERITRFVAQREEADGGDVL